MQICYGCMEKYDDGLDACPACGYVVDTPPVYDDCLYPGTVIGGRYTLGKAIGRGGFGITYLALDTDTGKRVVIKEYLPEGFAARDFGQNTVASTVDEEKYITGMKNAVDGSRAISEYDYLESVEKYIDCVEENGTVYIVREYFEGETIKERVEKNGVFTYQETVETIIPVLRSLSGLHEKGFVHGNINPDSIIMCNNGRVKLIDLGLKAESPYALRRGFAPAEQYENIEEITGATDIYSASAVIYYMLTGIVPPDSRVRGTGRDSFIPISELAFIPESVEKVIMQGLEPDVNSRIVTADDVADAMIMRKKAESEAPSVTDASADSDEKSGKQSLYKKLMKKKFFRKIRKYLPALVGFGGVMAILLITVLIAVICVLVKNSKKNTDIDKESTTISIIEDEKKESVIFTPTQAVEKYRNFLDEDDFKTVYPDVYAVRIHDIERYPEDKTLPKGIKSLDYASVAAYYYDIDIDGTNEMIYAVRLDSSTRYVSVYIFDIDEEGNVFEADRLEYSESTVENLYLCDVKANGLTYYYFLRYSGSAYEGQSDNQRSFECLYYDGKSLYCGASGGQNKMIKDDGEGYSSLAAYCITGSMNQSDGKIWEPTDPTPVKSVYVYDNDNYVSATEGFTAVSEEAFEAVWSRNVTSADLKCEFMKNLSAMVEGSVSFSVSFKGPITDEDVEFVWKINGKEVPILYTDSGRDIVYSGEVSADEFGAEYKIELYTGEYRYSSCIIRLDEEGNPVYNYGEIELAWMPKVVGKYSAAAIAQVKAAGFKNVTTKSGSLVGLRNATSLGKVERQSVAGGAFYPVDTPITITVYV